MACKYEILGREYSEKEYSKIRSYTRDGFISAFLEQSDDPVLEEKLSVISLLLKDQPGDVYIMPSSLDPQRSDSYESTVFGYFDPGSGSIVLFNDNDVSPETLIERFLHESMHRITKNIISKYENGVDLDHNESNYYDSMLNIFSEFRKSVSDSGINPDTIYGLSSLDEFMSETFKSNDLQVFLGSYDSSSELTPIARLLESIWSFISSLLGENSAWVSNHARSKYLLRRAIIANQAYLYDLQETDTHNEILDETISRLDPRFIKSSKRGGTNYFHSDGNKKSIPKDGIKTLSELIKIMGSTVDIEFFGESIEDIKEKSDVFAQKVVSKWEEIPNNSKKDIMFYGPITKRPYSISRHIELRGKDQSKLGRDELLREVSDILKKEILPEEVENSRDIKESLLGWLKNGPSIESAKISFPIKENNELKSFLSDEILMDILYHVDHKGNERYYKLSEAVKEGVINADISKFKGFDPVIKIGELGGKKTISIIDVTNENLGSGNETLVNKSIFYAFTRNNASDYVSGVSFSGSNGGKRQLSALIQMSHLIKNNPEIVVQNVFAMSIGSGGIQKRSVLPIDDLRNLDNLLKIEPIISSLDTDIAESINYKNHIKRENAFTGVDYLEYLKESYSSENYSWSTSTGNRSYSYNDDMYYKNFFKSYKNFKEQSDLRSILDLLRKRVSFLEKKLKSSKTQDERVKNELETISTILVEYALAGYGKVDKDGKINTLNPNPSARDGESEITRRLVNTHNVGNPYVQVYVEEVLKASFESIRRTKEVFSDYEKELKKIVGNRNIKAFLFDSRSDIFSDMFIYKDVQDSNDRSSKIKINTGNIHWDINNEETKNAIKNGEISVEKVAFGKYLMDSIEKLFIEDEFRRIVQEDLSGTIQDAMALAKSRVTGESYPWKKGMMPIMYKDTSEHFSNFDWSKMLSSMTNAASNPDTIFNDNRYLDDLDNEPNSFINWFTSDTSPLSPSPSTPDSSIFGNKNRISKIGLSYDDSGEAFVLDVSKNEEVSTNIDRIFRSFVMTTIRKNEFEKRAIPMVHSVKRVLEASQVKNGIDNTQSLKYIENMSPRLIGMKNRKFDDRTFFGRAGNNASVLMQGITAFTGTALSLPIGVLSVVSGGINLASLTMAQKTYPDMFGKKELFFALSELFKPGGTGKMLAIAKYYGVFEGTERDLTDSPTHNRMSRHLFQSHFAQIMNYLPDISIRGVVMAAQMKKDGVYEAHSYSNETGISYDESKDTRDKKLLKKIKEDIVLDGIFDQKENEPLKMAYSWRQIQKLKMISDKYVIGSMDQKAQTELDTHVGSRGFMQFRRHLPERFNNSFGSRTVSRFGGWYGKDENENWIWMNNETEGQYKTVLRLVKENGLRSGSMILKAAFSSSPDNGMSETEIFNARKLIYDLSIFTILMIIYSGLVDEKDDKEDSGIYENRLVYSVKNAFMDLVATVWPGSILWTASNPMPTISILSSAWNVITSAAQMEKPEAKDIRRITPLTSTIESFKTEE